jgi:hypothetical protein
MTKFISDKDAKKLLSVYEKVSLSDSDLAKATGGKCNILVYADLERADSLDDVLGKDKCAIILYQSSEDYGHWICLIEHSKDTLEVFDSLGYKIDDELKWTPNRLYKGKLLSRLINESDYKNVIYNNIRLQSDPKANTCGKWCVVRIKFREMPLDTFIKLFTSKKAKAIDIPDRLVSCLYFMIEKKLIK